MVKKTNYPSSEVGKLKDTINKLKAQVRQLRKELKESRSTLEVVHDAFTEEEIAKVKENRRDKIEKKRVDLCQGCGNPTVEKIQIGVWTVISCEACDYTEKKQN